MTSYNIPRVWRKVSLFYGKNSTVRITPACAGKSQHSIHALREESDFARMDSRPSGMSFQSTLSARRATYIHTGTAESAEFQSTLSARRATDLTKMIISIDLISIHALREESDRAKSV